MLLRELCKSSEINSPLSDLHHLLLALALVVLIGVLIWIRLLGLRAILGKMVSTAAIIAPIVAIPTIELLGHSALGQTAAVAAAEALEV